MPCTERDERLRKSSATMVEVAKNTALNEQLKRVSELVIVATSECGGIVLVQSSRPT